MVASSNVNWTRNDGLTGVYVNGSPAYYDHMSLMRDMPDKNKHAFKPCVHMSYDAEVSPWDTADDNPGDPTQWILYHQRSGFPYGQHTPPVLSSAESYIPVSLRSSNDIMDCVFQAYNTYINGFRALDSSQSIAELNETPQLFQIWNRRRGLATNLTNGFLNYSFGWRPVLNDLRAISSELRQFPASVRKRLHRIGQKKITRHFSFDFSDTVNTTAGTYGSGGVIPNPGSFLRRYDTDISKSRRKIIVTLRANVKPKLQGNGQDILNKLGTLGLIPSLATVWAVTRYSFVVDWFFNIGGAIENLQGSLTHDISNVEICVTDLRQREIRILWDTGWSHAEREVGREKQRYFGRSIPSYSVPFIPSLKVPGNPMQYVLLGLLALSGSRGGQHLLRTADRYENLLDRRLKRIEDALNKRLGLRPTNNPWGSFAR
jgi:hypothetical protein